MKQAHVSLHKGMPLNWGYRQKFNGMPIPPIQWHALSECMHCNGDDGDGSGGGGGGGGGGWM